ncbi:copper oxidase, partial [Pseudomonas sp. RIT-PI-r]
MDRTTRDPSNTFLLTPLSVFLMLTLGTMAGVRASPIDDERQPEVSDPSAYYDEPADRAGALNAILTMPEANEDSFDLPDGVKGDRAETRIENVLPPSVQTSFNYPTNGKPSPLYGAQPFTQQLTLFEEFGPEKLDPTTPAAPLPFPPAAIGPAPAQDPNNIARSAPPGTALDAFLRQPGLTPFPSQFANVVDRNPWQAQIEVYLNRHIGSSAEGRPPGKGWAHQRWNEFYPQVAYKTVQTGARLNGGLRGNGGMPPYPPGEVRARRPHPTRAT